MPTYKSPDVYVEEISIFPPSVAEVGTAIPAFIGYTRQAKANVDGDLTLKPTKIFSFGEFEALFGGPAAPAIQINIEHQMDAGGTDIPGAYQLVSITPADKPGDRNVPGYFLYYSVRMYFDNGGSTCYIVSVGGLADPIAAADIEAGLATIELEDEPTLLIVPEAINLTRSKYGDVVQAILMQAGKLKDRFGIFDIQEGEDQLEIDDPEEANNETILLHMRAQFGTNNLKYGAAYYPFLRTTFNYNLTETDAGSNLNVKVDGAAPAELTTFKESETAVYNFAKAALANYFLTLPPSGAVAGVYAATDAVRGVWKSPANVSLTRVIEPAVKLDNTRQDNLNVDATTGKSINAIRSFAGKGTLVWGARTLDGNSNEWRYVAVRRFFNMVEESVKKSTYWAVFEPNDANTWVKVRGMIENYLIDKWRDGALAGATPKEAFFVKCGLGSTMTAQDILEGRMNVEIGMAVVRPAEFIVLKFSHKLQTS